MPVRRMSEIGGNLTITPTVYSEDEYTNYSTQDYQDLDWILPYRLNWGCRLVYAGRVWNEAARIASLFYNTNVHVAELLQPGGENLLLVHSHGYGTCRRPPVYGWFKKPPVWETRENVIKRMVEVNLLAQKERWLRGIDS